MAKKNTIILGVTGSIAAYKACEATSALKALGYNVQVVMTKEAKEFIQPLSLATLSQNKVLDELFALPEEYNPIHVALAEKADLVLILPASANILAKAACGIADDVLSCLLLSTQAALIFCPAMNEKMFLHPAVQANIACLKKRGCIFVGPIKGRLSNGKIGLGRLAQTETILQAVKKALS